VTHPVPSCAAEIEAQLKSVADLELGFMSVADKHEALTLGRSLRLFSRAQRKAMRLRDKRCRAVGCRIPAAWCEAHHARDPLVPRGPDRPGQLLCSFHHHRAHDPGYVHAQLRNGDVRFQRRR
jgi:hypothetical protein